MFLPQHSNRLRHLTTLALASVLAACGSSSAPTAESAATFSQSPQETGATSANNSDVPSLHDPKINDSFTVAPGLIVSYQSIVSPASAAVRDPCDVKVAFTIQQSGSIIFRDTTNGCDYDPLTLDSLMRKVYPLWVPTGKGSGELMVAYNNRPLKDLARRFFIKGQRVIKIDTLLTFDSPPRDEDGDGKMELAGIWDYGEEWTDEQGRVRRSYNPTLFYEVRPTGLALDSALIIRRARAEFGKFYGFEYSDKPVVFAK